MSEADLVSLQCRRLILPPDKAYEAVFDQGTEVGQLARQLFPGGTVVAPGIIEPDEVIAQTQKAIQVRRPLYEAAFAFTAATPARTSSCRWPVMRGI